MRRRLSRRGSKRLFSATARKYHRGNLVKPMRGGKRL